MRITSQMMLSHYKSDVSDAYNSMAKAMRHAYDYRAFDLPSDDPLAASQTSEVHFEMSRNDDYASNISNVKGEITSADKILMNVDSLLTNAKTLISAADASKNGSDRETYGDQLLDIRDEIVSQLNTQYSDSYIFSGTGSGSPPFELVKDPNGASSNDKLYYRGIDVDTGFLKSPPSPPNTLPTVSLDDLAKEKSYVDIGLGLGLDASGKINDQTAFNRSMPGISYLGYADKDGTPQNVCSLLTKIGSTLKSSKDDGALSQSDKTLVDQYTAALGSQQDVLNEGQSSVGNKLSFLVSTANYVSSTSLSLAQKDNDVEYVQPTDAIEDFYSQMYCYNAALKVGGQILQQSLMDYLK